MKPTFTVTPVKARARKPATAAVTAQPAAADPRHQAGWRRGQRAHGRERVCPDPADADITAATLAPSATEAVHVAPTLAVIVATAQDRTSHPDVTTTGIIMPDAADAAATAADDDFMLPHIAGASTGITVAGCSICGRARMMPTLSQAGQVQRRLATACYSCGDLGGRR